MSEPIKVFVLSWDDGTGVPNCDLYRNAYALPESIVAQNVVKWALDSPGEAFSVTDEDGNEVYLRYMTVQE